MRKLIGFAFLCGCASQGVPPGGPPDAQAPSVISVTPDSGRTSVKSAAAVFRFDEVVSERPAAATTLGDLFIVSPRQGAPNVSWHREEIEVRPRKGWLPNTTYTVAMLPGIADLRGNVRNTGASTFFSTGTKVDNGVIAGSVYDLITDAASSGALVEARLGSDTTISWIARTDSAGGFRLAHLPQRTFLVRAYIDKNRNFGADPDEPVDTITVAAAENASANFFIAVRDSIAPRVAAAVATDSMTVAVTFDRPTDSATATAPASYSVVGSDSSNIPVRSVRLPKRDTLAKRPLSTRPLPVISVVISLARPLAPKIEYRARAAGIRGVLGQTLPSETPITRPAAVEPARRVPPPPPPNLPGGAVPIPIKHD